MARGGSSGDCLLFSAKAIAHKVPSSSPQESAVARPGGWTMLLRCPPFPKWSNVSNDGAQQVNRADVSALHASTHAYQRVRYFTH